MLLFFSGIFDQILHYFGKMTPQMISNGNETALNESGIIENVYIEPKISNTGQCDEEISPS